MADTFELEILTPSKKVFDGEVLSLGVQTTRGRIEIFPGHAEMVCVLDIGVVHLDFPGDYGFGIAVHGGIMKIHPGQGEDEDGDEVPDKVQILASEGEHPEHIDIERAEAALGRAEEAMQITKVERDMAQRALNDRLRAEARIGAFKTFKKQPELEE